MPQKTTRTVFTRRVFPPRSDRYAWSRRLRSAVRVHPQPTRRQEIDEGGGEGDEEERGEQERANLLCVHSRSVTERDGDDNVSRTGPPLTTSRL